MNKAPSETKLKALFIIQLLKENTESLNSNTVCELVSDFYKRVYSENDKTFSGVPLDQKWVDEALLKIDKNMVVYINGWNDSKIAKATGSEISSVQLIRKSNFGRLIASKSANKKPLALGGMERGIMDALNKLTERMDRVEENSRHPKQGQFLSTSEDNENKESVAVDIGGKPIF